MEKYTEMAGLWGLVSYLADMAMQRADEDGKAWFKKMQERAEHYARVDDDISEKEIGKIILD